MKKTWKKPILEVLDVSETMKRWPGHGGGGGGHDEDDPDPSFDS